jgi:hypothetical protein
MSNLKEKQDLLNRLVKGKCLKQLNNKPTEKYDVLIDNTVVQIRNIIENDMIDTCNRILINKLF